jgi:hypothetical protein
MSQHYPTPAPAPGPDSDPSTWPLGCALYVFGSVVINTGQIMIRLSHLAEASGQVRTPAALPHPLSAPNPGPNARVCRGEVGRGHAIWGAGLLLLAGGDAVSLSLPPSHQCDRLSLSPPITPTRRRRGRPR